EPPGALDVGAQDGVELVAGAGGAVVVDGLGEGRGGADVVGEGQGVGPQAGAALLGGGVVDEQHGRGAAATGVVQVHDDHVALLGGRRDRRAALGGGGGQTGDLSGVPEVADAAD